VFLLAKLDKPRGIVQPRVELGIGRERAIEVLALAQELLCPLWVIPKRRVLGDRIQVLETGLRLIPVKDASATATGIA
jgi:hypothetical protein